MGALTGLVGTFKWPQMLEKGQCRCCPTLLLEDPALAEFVCMQFIGRSILNECCTLVTHSRFLARR